MASLRNTAVNCMFLDLDCIFNRVFQLQFSMELCWNLVSTFCIHPMLWFPANSPKMPAAYSEPLKTYSLKGTDCIILESHKNQIVFYATIALNPYTIYILFALFSSYLWSLCKLKLKLSRNITNFENVAHNLAAVFSSKSKVSIAKNSFSATVWHIWQEQNRRTFQAQEKNKIMVYRNLYEDIHVLIQNCHWKTNSGQRELEILSNWGLRL